MENRKRQANIELLRIISMLMVIFWHFMVHGERLSDQEKIFTDIFLFEWVMETFCIICVNLYVMISGYFLVDSKFNLRKLIMLLLEVWFYSAGFFLISVAMGGAKLSLDEIAHAFFPVLTRQYWFVSVYVALYVLFPFMNIAIRNVTKKQHFLLIGILVLLFAIFPNSMLAFGGGMSINWFITLYFIAAYLKKYYCIGSHKSKISLTYFAGIVLLFISRLFTEYFYKYNTILVLACSVTFMMMFINLQINNKILEHMILVVSPLTFGIYLIHDNNYIRDFLWGLVSERKYLDSWISPLYLVGITVLIFVICGILDKIRIESFKILKINELISKILKWIEKKCEKKIGVSNILK